MKIPIFLSSLMLISHIAFANPTINVDLLGEYLGGWDAKKERAANYEISGSKYRTWKPEFSPMLNGGLFISLRIDHLRGLLSSNDHASLQITLDKDGNIISAQSSMAFQGRKITSDAIRLGSNAGTSILGVESVAKIGTDLLADLSSKILRENVAEPGRVTFPSVIHHNYNLLCITTKILEKKNSQTPAQLKLQLKTDKKSAKNIGQVAKLPTLP